ncbi:uncharacterized protein [Prorops nasuta]|uniref:uncharacterized protein isoform X2 n=1 Tax=Prorops nasuta TaxID=863751 RepID=UPI0034CFCDFD
MFALDLFLKLSIIFCGQCLYASSRNHLPLLPSFSEYKQPSYDITLLIDNLNLQECTIVEIGEGFCSIFLEVRDAEKEIKEFFIGSCSCSTLHLWNFCSENLKKKRNASCIFAEANPLSDTNARVHRRFCDIGLLKENAPECNCSLKLAGHDLHKTRDPLPESLCSPRGVCGIAQCSGLTINGIHSPHCADNCPHRQPFCEEVESWTSLPVKITSEWSDWSTPKCSSSCGTGFLVSSAFCRNPIKYITDRIRLSNWIFIFRLLYRNIFCRREPANDCVGPGILCCQNCTEQCRCTVTSSSGTMVVTRFTEACMSMEGCALNNEGSFVPSVPRRIVQRRLLDIRSRKWKMIRAPFVGHLGRIKKRYINVDDSDDQDEDDDEDEEDEEEDDRGIGGVDDETQEENENEDSDDELEKEEEEEEEGMASLAEESPRKRARVPRSDYEGEQVIEPIQQSLRVRQSVTNEDSCEEDKTDPPLQYYEYDPDAVTVSPSSSGSISKIIKQLFILIYLLRMITDI